MVLEIKYLTVNAEETARTASIFVNFYRAVPFSIQMLKLDFKFMSTRKKGSPATLSIIEPLRISLLFALGCNFISFYTDIADDAYRRRGLGNLF